MNGVAAGQSENIEEEVKALIKKHAGGKKVIMTCI